METIVISILVLIFMLIYLPLIARKIIYHAMLGYFLAWYDHQIMIDKRKKGAVN